MSFLYEHGGSTPKINRTIDSDLLMHIDDEIGVLFDYIFGEHADKNKHEKLIIDSIKKMHEIMQTYPYHLEHRDESFYINRYLDILSNVEYDPEKIDELAYIGRFFFQQVEHLEKGFCHGDMHTGNLIIDKDSKAIIIDFDVCGYLSPLVDFVTYYDQTNFNKFNEVDVYKTINILENQHWIDSRMINYMIAMIPVRHFEIIATILDIKGYKDVKYAFYDEQYHWIKSFYKVYQKICV
jgi:thiamine kinase-like enzyme